MPPKLCTSTLSAPPQMEQQAPPQLRHHNLIPAATLERTNLRRRPEISAMHKSTRRPIETSLETPPLSLHDSRVRTTNAHVPLPQNAGMHVRWNKTLAAAYNVCDNAPTPSPWTTLYTTGGLALKTPPETSSQGFTLTAH